MRAILCGALLTLGLGGCATTFNSESVSEIHLFGLPITLNLDGIPGADGFAARVYMTQGGHAKGSTISAGTVEILMFDGVVGMDDLLKKEPTQSWKFNARELAKLEEQTSLGHGYRFILRWSEAPKRGHITVIARYLSPKGVPMYSSPSTITAAVK